MQSGKLYSKTTKQKIYILVYDWVQIQVDIKEQRQSVHMGSLGNI